MTIDEALHQVHQAKHCFIIRNSETGEPLEIIGFDHDLVIEERIQCLSRMKSHSGAVVGKMFDAKMVTRATFETMTEEATDTKQRVAWYNRTAKEPLPRLLEMLEQRTYPLEVEEFHGAAHVVSILFGFRRHELTPDIVERLRVLSRGESYKDCLEPAAQRTLTVNLAYLDGDIPALRAMWAQALQGKMTLGNRIHLIKCFGSLRDSDSGIIADLIGVVREPGFFEPRFEAMIALGRIGPPVGSKAAKAIHAAIYNSEEYVIKARERVCARILSPEREWYICPNCDRGRVPATSYGIPSSAICQECRGLAWLPLLPS